MPEPMTNTPNTRPAETEVHQAQPDPKGVLPKNLKPWLYCGAALLVITAAVFSGTGGIARKHKEAASQQTASSASQDNTESNQQELRSNAAAEEQGMSEQGKKRRGPARAEHDACAAGRGCRLRPQW